MKTSKLIDQNPLSKIPTGSLMIVIVITVSVALFLAWYFRNNYNPKRLIRSYLIYGLPYAVLGLILQIPITLLIGIWLMGAGILVLRSNHYFYEH